MIYYETFGAQEATGEREIYVNVVREIEYASHMRIKKKIISTYALSSIQVGCIFKQLYASI